MKFSVLAISALLSVPAFAARMDGTTDYGGTCRLTLEAERADSVSVYVWYSEPADYSGSASSLISYAVVPESVWQSALTSDTSALVDGIAGSSVRLTSSAAENGERRIVLEPADRAAWASEFDSAFETVLTVRDGAVSSIQKTYWQKRLFGNSLAKVLDSTCAL